jgi:hypothetical protein
MEKKIMHAPGLTKTVLCSCYIWKLDWIDALAGLLSLTYTYGAIQNSITVSSMSSYDLSRVTFLGDQPWDVYTPVTVVSPIYADVKRLHVKTWALQPVDRWNREDHRRKSVVKERRQNSRLFLFLNIYSYKTVNYMQNNVPFTVSHIGMHAY